MADEAVIKLMHYARFDVAVLQHSLGITVGPVRCTKIAARLVRTFTDRFGLKDLCRDLLGVELSKQQQSSDWGAPELTSEQLAYAASDVLYLHALWAKLEALLIARIGWIWPRPVLRSCRPARGSTSWVTTSRTFFCIRRIIRVQPNVHVNHAIKHPPDDFLALRRPQYDMPDQRRFD